MIVMERIISIRLSVQFLGKSEYAKLIEVNSEKGQRKNMIQYDSMEVL